MKVVSFSVSEDRHLSFHDAYRITEGCTPCIHSILRYEKDAVTTILRDRDPWSSPVLTSLLEREGLTRDDIVQPTLDKLMSKERACKYRLCISLHESALTNGMYDGVYCHMAIIDDKYIGHFLTYDHIDKIGCKDLYVSIYTDDSADASEFIYLSIERLATLHNDKNIVVERHKPLIKSVLSYIDRCTRENPTE